MRRGARQGDHFSAFQLYLSAIQKDRTFTPAYAGFAAAILRGWQVGWQIPSNVSRAGLSGMSNIELLNDTLTKGLALAPDNAKLLATSALFQLWLFHHERARQLADKALSSRPHDPSARWIVAQVRLASPRPSEARAGLLALAAETDRLDPDLLRRVGADLVLLGEARLGLEMLREALARGIGYRGVLSYMIAAHELLGNKADASRELERLKEIWPGVNWTYFAIFARHFKNKALVDRFLGALADVGVPRWARGYHPNERHRLSERELNEFFIPGAQVHGMPNRDLRIDSDQICGPTSVLDREFCTPVYRNPSGTRNELNEFLRPSYDGQGFDTFSVVVQ